MRLTLRWKLFALISVAVAAPVAAVTLYFPAAYLAAQEAALTSKAISFAHMLEEDVRSAVAFDDVETANEEFTSTALDTDVAFLALFRADGTLIESRGKGNLEPPAPPHGTVVSRHDDRVRVVMPVISVEGPRGVVVLELSTARVRAEGAHFRRTGLLVGGLAVLFGLVTAWLVGRSFGRRIGRVIAQAVKVAGGDLAAKPLLDESGDEIGRLAGVFDDMVQTIERIVAERTEALEASRSQLRGLLESTHAVPWQMRPGVPRFTYVGPQAATAIPGMTGDWLAADFWSTRVNPEDSAAVTAVFDEVLAGRPNRETEVRLRRDDGRMTWIRLLVGGGRDDRGPILRGFMFDVTERRRLETELRLAQRLQSVGRLAAGVAHELNTPVQYVGDSIFFVRDGLADLTRLLAASRRAVDAVLAGAPAEEAAAATVALAEEIDVAYLAENLPSALDRAIEGLNRVSGIVGSMKQLANPEQKRRTQVDLNQIVESTLTISRNEYKYVADVVTDLGTIPLVFGHGADLSQALLNVIVNAAQAIAEVERTSGQRGVIRIRTESLEHAVVVSIGDSGCGIAPEIRNHIFDLFFTTREPGEGTGMGLATARSIVEKHGGEVSFESEVGRGTVFRLRFPIGPESRSTAEPAVFLEAAAG